MHEYSNFVCSSITPADATPPREMSMKLKIKALFKMKELDEFPLALTLYGSSVQAAGREREETS